MKKRIQKWWFETMILPQIKKNKAAVITELKNDIVYRMWYAGVGFTNMNKWLSAQNLEPITGYCIEGPQKDIRIFYGEISAEQNRKYKIKKVY
jgi:hypothetical protein